MDQIYNEIYKVINLFQENKYQKIYMGESIEDSALTIVITEFIKSDFIDKDFIDTLKNNLDNLLYFTENETTATFITRYDEGMSIFQVIENIPNTTNFRTNILHDYLNKLRKFDALLPIFQFILASNSQFYVEDNELIHNELIIIDEDKIDTTFSFTDVKNRIKDFSLMVLDYTPSTEDAELITLLRNFFNDLESDMSLNSIDKIYEAYKKIYIYDMYLDKNDSSNKSAYIAAGVKNTSDASIEDEHTRKKRFILPFSNNNILLFNKEKYAINPLYISLIIIAISIGLFAIFTPMIMRINDTDIPTASFEKERFEDQWKFINRSKTSDDDNRIEEIEWKIYSDNELINTFSTYNLNLTFNTEGIYKITLRIMDSYGNWSLPYTEEIFHTLLSLDPIDEQDSSTEIGTESLNSYTIDFNGDLSFDESKFRTGNKSIQMQFSGDETQSIDLNRLFLDNNVKISFWINATDDTPLTITATGINEGNEVFSISRVHYPKIDQWQKITFTTNTSYVNNLKISVNAEDMTLWIDDIEVNSYK
ncbi:MAG: hypothetical protein U9Q80_10220 [Bacillota bacterium]|nr:hypothetical protein [Bacillota bacterium]